MKNNFLNKTKWYLKNTFLFFLNPLLTIKNNFDFDFLNALQANKNFINEFLSNWPSKSSGYKAYFDRIINGPDYNLADSIISK